MHKATLIPGDGTGPQIAESVCSLLAAAGVQIDWEICQLSETGEIGPEVLESARRTGRVLMGFHRGHRDLGRPPAIVQLRKDLQLFANHRPVRNLAGIPSRYQDVDLLVIRETTEDIYARIEHESIRGVFESMKVTTRPACKRIARHAFETARQLGRKKVTTVHKANIMKLSDGMFLQTAKDIGTDYPDIEHDECIVDALCMKLVANPHQFDVLLAGNLFGDIVGDVTAGLVGGESNCPSVNVGEGVTVYAAPHGDDHGDPLTLLHAARVMVRAMGEDARADRLRGAMEQTLMAGVKPHALGGTATCSAITEAIGSRL